MRNSKNKTDSISSKINELKEQGKLYLEERSQYYILGIIDRVGGVLALISFSLVIFGILLCCFIFGFMGLGFLFGRIFNSNYAIGFAIVGGIWLLLLGILYLFRSKIERHLYNLFIGILYRIFKKKSIDEEDENEE